MNVPFLIRLHLRHAVAHLEMAIAYTRLQILLTLRNVPEISAALYLVAIAAALKALHSLYSWIFSAYERSP
jgi:hypothetical protein